MPSTGTPELKIACGARGEPASCTDSGPAGEDHGFRIHLRRRRLRPSGTARSRNRRPPRARGARSAASPACRNRRSEFCRAPRPRRASALGFLCCCHGKQIRDGAALATAAKQWPTCFYGMDKSNRSVILTYNILEEPCRNQPHDAARLTALGSNVATPGIRTTSNTSSRSTAKQRQMTSDKIPPARARRQRRAPPPPLCHGKQRLREYWSMALRRGAPTCIST